MSEILFENYLFRVFWLYSIVNKYKSFQKDENHTNSAKVVILYVYVAVYIYIYLAKKSNTSRMQ